jgi:hypothetical protein
MIRQDAGRGRGNKIMAQLPHNNDNFLWTEGSVFYHCGHHVEYHHTKVPLYTLCESSNNRIYCCEFVRGEESCSFSGFEPDKIMGISK